MEDNKKLSKSDVAKLIVNCDGLKREIEDSFILMEEDNPSYDKYVGVGKKYDLTDFPLGFWIHAAIAKYQEYTDKVGMLLDYCLEGNEYDIKNKLKDYYRLHLDYEQLFNAATVTEKLIDDENDLFDSMFFCKFSWPTINYDVWTTLRHWINSDMEDVIKESESQQNQEEPMTEQPEDTNETRPKESAMENTQSTTIDVGRLDSFFKAKFKGKGTVLNYFDVMIEDLQSIKVSKEFGMVAAMIYDCKQFIKPSTIFAQWFRTFFEIIGRECPKNTHKSQYKPSEPIKKRFSYLETPI